MQDQPPAVGQIVIAETLMEQFVRVLESLKKEVESTGPESDSVYIAEGNRVYPGIWEHLDQARAFLAAGGTDVADYDGLRAGADRNIGIWDFQRRGTEARLTKTVEVYSWKANDQGVELARQASELLKSKMPEVDWAEVQRAAEAEPTVDLGTGAGTIKIAMAAGGIVVLVLLWLLLR